MANLRASIHIIRDEYQLFVLALPKDSRLPTRYDEWEKQKSESDARFRALGEHTQEIVVNFKTFSDYCQSTGRPPSYYMLEAVATANARIKN